MDWKRYAVAMGRTELASTGVEARMLEVQKATIDSAASSRLDQIRASLGSGSGGPGAGGQQALNSGETAAIEPGTTEPAEDVQVPTAQPQQAQPEG